MMLAASVSKLINTVAMLDSRFWSKWKVERQGQPVVGSQCSSELTKLLQSLSSRTVDTHFYQI